MQRRRDSGPRIPLMRPYFDRDEERMVIDTLRSGWVTQGPRVREFEASVCAFTGARYGVATTSCTTALHLALLAVGVRPGDEVICPSLTFIATAHAIRHAGAVPRFVDIDPRTLNLDPAKLQGAITRRTRAILPVHQLGWPADMGAILEVARGRGIPVVEDAACALGAEYRGRRIGRPFGDVVCLSFHPRKLLTTGEGGMITTDDREIADRCRRLRHQGMSVSDAVRHASRRIETERYAEEAYNYRMSDLQAAVGVAQMRKLEAILRRRRAQADVYRRQLDGAAPLEISRPEKHELPTYQTFWVRLKAPWDRRRDRVMQRLLDAGIATRRACMASHHERPYRSCAPRGGLPETDAAARSTLALPMFHAMTAADQADVSERLRGALT